MGATRIAGAAGTSLIADVTARNALKVEGAPIAGGGTDGSTQATGAAAGIAPAIAAVAAKTGYCTGFRVDGLGATAASVIDVTVTGLLGGTRTFKLSVPAGATVAVTPLVVTFPHPLPASAVNTAITLNVPSFGAGNTSAIGQIFGYTA